MNRRRAVTILLNAAALAGLIWTVHDLPLSSLMERTRGMNWGWVAAAVLFDAATYVFQAVRWRALLAPEGSLQPWRAGQAIYAGLFLNEVTPLRLGEVVRAYLVSRWMGLRVAVVVPSMLVERLIDGIWLAVGVAIVALVMPLPPMLERGGEVLGIGMAAGLFLFVWLVLRPVPRRAGEPASRWQTLRTRLHDGIVRIGFSRAMTTGLVVSVLLPVSQGIAFWLVMRAYGISLPLAAGMAVMLIVRLGTLVPAAPANVGTFHFFCTLALTLFGIDKGTAAGFSVVLFFVLTIPLWAIGLAAIAATGETTRSLMSEAASL